MSPLPLRYSPRVSAALGPSSAFMSWSFPGFPSFFLIGTSSSLSLHYFLNVLFLLYVCECLPACILMPQVLSIQKTELDPYGTAMTDNCEPHGVLGTKLLSSSRTSRVNAQPSLQSSLLPLNLWGVLQTSSDDLIRFYPSLALKSLF